jgi:hypothetical protein
MTLMRCFAAVLVCSCFSALLVAQKEKREPLTDVQIEQIREAGTDPAYRINLYVKFLNEHAEAIKGLGKRGYSAARNQRLDNELQNFAGLVDELGSNLDTYGERRADLRAALKPLNEATPHWVGMLRALTGEPEFDVSRKEAIESVEDLADQGTRLLAEQSAYFNLHPDEKGQDRAEPK